MKKQLTSQQEKFEATMKKTAALKSEKKKIDEKKQRKNYAQADRYGMTNTEALFEGHATNVVLSVIDMYGEEGAKDLQDRGILEEKAAVVMSHSGFDTWMETLTIDRKRIAEETAQIVMGEMYEHVFAPMRAQMDAMERQINLLLAIQCRSKSDDRPARFEVEEIKEEVQEPVVIPAPIFEVKEEIVEVHKASTAKKSEVTSQTGWVVEWKTGKRPQHVVNAVNIINQHFTAKQLKWPKDHESIKALVKEFLIVAKYEKLDINNTFVLQKSKYARVTSKITAVFGSYKNLLKELFPDGSTK